MHDRPHLRERDRGWRKQFAGFRVAEPRRVPRELFELGADYIKRGDYEVYDRKRYLDETFDSRLMKRLLPTLLSPKSRRSGPPSAN
jgi:hypothetical protein